MRYLRHPELRNGIGAWGFQGQEAHSQDDKRYQSRSVYPTHSKPNSEMPRFAAEEEFVHRKAIEEMENKPQIRLPQGEGVGIAMEQAGGLGRGKGDWRQEKREATGVLHRCIWVTCFCIFKNTGTLLDLRVVFQSSDVKRPFIIHLCRPSFRVGGPNQP